MAGKITSEFLFKFRDSKANVIASVPLEHEIAYLDPQNLLNRFSNSKTSLPRMKLFFFNYIFD